jgi:S-adenosylmethionine decarboxylase proenzyme
MRSLGRHLLIEYFGCDRDVLSDRDRVREAMREAARRANATIVTDVFHTFNPHGLSGVVVVAESHLAIHTWPEHACAAVDVFTCSEKMRPEVIVGYLAEVLRAKESVSREVERGTITTPWTKEDSKPSVTV